MVANLAALAADTATVAQDEGVVIIGLETGDTVKLYQVLQWNTNTGWGKTTAFNSLADASVTTLVGTPGTYDATTNTTTGAVAGTFTPAIASEIKGIYDANPSMASIGPKTANTITEGFGVKFTKSADNLAPGLYMAIVTPDANNNVVTYNPVFVACDFDSTNSNTQDLVTNLVIANVGYAKKENDIDLNKWVTDADGNRVTEAKDEWATADKDEILLFTVETTIPSYHSAEWDVSKISYTLTDSLNGLALVNDASHLPTVKVKAHGSSDALATLNASNYDLTADNGATSLTLSIKPAYLKEITGPYDLEITYSAKITDAAVTNVSTTDNKVTLEYSNNPQDETSKGTKHDVTNHYKFAIDAELFGDSEYHTSELVKIGLGPDGKPIYEKTGYSNYTTHSALADAKFGLYSSYADAAAAIGTDGNGLVSGADGRFLISNLDVGTYYLVETKAPAGYIRDNLIYKIDITATSKSITVNDGDCTYTSDVLDTYTVSVSTMDSATAEPALQNTSTYTMEYYGKDATVPQNVTIHTDKTITLKSSSKVTEDTKDSTHAEDNTTEIKNKQGTALPSTGGMGTTILYVGGSILVILAAVLLITKRRMNADE